MANDPLASQETTQPCGCCEGVEQLTPATIANRPWLPALAYRVGTHARFLETMKARLTGVSVDVPFAELDEHGAPVHGVDTLVPLQGMRRRRIERDDGSIDELPLEQLRLGLTTRASDDPAIALLDAWATVADVLTFYQERIANEGYLRTATERRSILELARLVGYALRPGVASTVYLAYTIDDNFKDTAVIDAGARSQSVPGPGELPQAFETVEKLDARSAWNTLRPRMSRPQTLAGMHENRVIYLNGVTTNLKRNDALLVRQASAAGGEVVRVADVTTELDADRTKVTIMPWERAKGGRASAPGPAVIATPAKPIGKSGDPLLSVMTGLSVLPSTPPANALRLSRDLKTAFAPRGDAGLQVVSAVRPDLSEALPAALGNVLAIQPSELEVYALRLKTGVYGNTASPRQVLDRQGRVIGAEDWPLNPYTFAVYVTIVQAGDNVVYNALIQVKAGGRTFSRQVLLPVGVEDEVELAPDIHVRVSHENEWRFSFAIGETGQTIDIAGTQEGSLLVWAERESEKLETRLSIGGSTSQSTGRRKLAAALQLDESARTRGLSITLSVEDETALPAVPDDVIALDGVYEQITPGSWVAIRTQSHRSPVVTNVAGAQAVGRTSFNFPAKVTELALNDAWLTDDDRWLADIRDTVVLAQSEKLDLAEEPIPDPICGGDQWVELDGVYSDLKPGRWVIVAGERGDIVDASGVPVQGLKSAELVMLAEIQHDIYRGQTEPPARAGQRVERGLTGGLYARVGKDQVERPGDRNHTFVKFARPLAYCYQRAHVTIYGNVVKATHGETRGEVMGAGDGAKAFQSFTLRQPPLTFVSAPTAAGAASTLAVYVNNVQWHEASSLAGLRPTDRGFVTRTDDDGKTTVVFGDGRQGARLPTGVENVRAAYRQGIGKAGNVQAEQITLLQSRPLGVKGVVNPMRASGGANKEGRDQARKNTPLAVMALDRLVSVRDYADFARTFAGVGKAVAARLSDGRRELVHVTIAGADDIPIDRTSDLYRNLIRALHDLGDPALAVQLDTRELLLLAVQAKVRILPDYAWEAVVSAVRSKLVDAFSFERRELGQDVALSEVIGLIQGVPGVAYVDVDTLGGIPESTTGADGERRLLTPAEIAATVQALLDDPRQPAPRVEVGLATLDATGRAIRPAQLAFLSPAAPDTLVLNQI